MEKEEQMLCEDWFNIGQDLICGAKQNGGAFWRRIG
jgi:hypothetical protein